MTQTTRLAFHARSHLYTSIPKKNQATTFRHFCLHGNYVPAYPTTVTDSQAAIRWASLEQAFSFCKVRAAMFSAVMDIQNRISSQISSLRTGSDCRVPTLSITLPLSEASKLIHQADETFLGKHPYPTSSLHKTVRRQAFEIILVTVRKGVPNEGYELDQLNTKGDLLPSLSFLPSHHQYPQPTSIQTHPTNFQPFNPSSSNPSSILITRHHHEKPRPFRHSRPLRHPIPRCAISSPLTSPPRNRPRPHLLRCRRRILPNRSRPPNAGELLQLQHQ